MQTMQIGTKTIGNGLEPLMFAEEGQANQGDAKLAMAMCERAAEAGADGIEFQFFLADDMYIPSDPGYGIYKSRELSRNAIREIIECAHSHGLLLQVAGLSPSLIQFCADAGADSFCVNATDLTNPEILDAVAHLGLPFWLATLMGTMEEITWSIDYLRTKTSRAFGLLHGQHVMSTDATQGVPPALLQLDCIASMKERFDLVTGFVDHTITLYVPALAAARGAAIVMKHLAPEKNWRGPDWVVCLDPDDWKKSRDMLRDSFASGGDSKELSIAEFKDRTLHRRSLYSRRELKAGTVITRGDLVALRPGQGGIDPRFLDFYAGRTVLNDLGKHQQIQAADFCGPSEGRNT
jgi:N,N'-diacetyllegionaminate synthase